MFFFIYIYSLQDKLCISPQIVCCDMIPNLGGPKGGQACWQGGTGPPWPLPRTAPAWHVSVIIWIIIHYACRLSDVLWRLVNTNWVISVPWLSAGRQSVHLYPAHCLMVAAGSWTWLSKHKITALSVWLLRFLKWRLGDVSYRLCIPDSVNEMIFFVSCWKIRWNWNVEADIWGKKYVGVQNMNMR